MKIIQILIVIVALIACSVSWSIGRDEYAKTSSKMSHIHREATNIMMKRTVAEETGYRPRIRLNNTAVATSVPFYKYMTISGLENAFNNAVYGAFDAGINGDIAVVAFEGFASLPVYDVFPAFVSYSGVQSGNLVLVDTIYQNFTYGSAAAAVCKNPTKRIVLQALLYTKTLYTNPFISPVNFMIVAYEYYANGSFNHTPKIWENLSSIQPDLYESAASYSGAVKFSEDCEYIIFTASLGATSPIPTNQTIGVVKLNSNWTLSNPIFVLYPSTNIPGYLYFPQTASMVLNDRTGVYLLILPSNTFTLTDIFGVAGTATLFSYSYDPATQKLALISNVSVPQYIQGIAVNNQGKKVVTIGDCVISQKQSFSRRCKTAYMNGAPSPNDEIRFYDISTSGVLSYDDSVDLNGWGGSGIFSPYDDKLVITWSPALLNTLINLQIRSFAPNIVSIYEVKTSKITLQDQSGASPLSFGLAFNENEQLLVAGMPMALQSEVQLFSLD